MATRMASLLMGALKLCLCRYETVSCFIDIRVCINKSFETFKLVHKSWGSGAGYN